MPLQADRTAFAVGRDLAITPGSVIARDDLAEQPARLSHSLQRMLRPDVLAGGLQPMVGSGTRAAP